MKKITIQKPESKGGGGLVPDGLEAHIRATLQGCTTAKLYKLLQLKNVPLRSKLRKKADRIEALTPILTPSELEEFGIEIICAPNESAKTRKKKEQKREEGKGKRRNNPVMGVDVHRDTLVWAIADPMGIKNEGTLSNTGDGIRSLISAVKKNKVEIVAMESTAELWVSLYWALHDEGIEALVANPAQLKETQGKKTDKFDARRIAFAIRDGRLLPSVVCNREQFSLRKSMRLLSKQVHNLTSVKNRMNQIFKRTAPSKRIKKYLKSKRGLFILKAGMRCTSFDEVYEIIQEAYSKGRGKTSHQETLKKYTEEMWTFIQGLDAHYERSRFTLLLGEYLEREANIAHLEREGLIYAKRHPSFLDNIKLLISVPGIDIRSALIIMSEIVDIKYFKTPKKLAKWTGLVPRNKQSGYKKRSTGKLHKRGNKFLRRALWAVAQSESSKANREGHSIRQFIHRLKEKGTKAWKTIITAGARKLLVLIHHLLWEQEEYNVMCKNEYKMRIEVGRERKLHNLKRSLKSLPVNEVVPAFIHRLEQSWGRYTSKLRSFEQLCSEMLGKGSLEGIK